MTNTIKTRRSGPNSKTIAVISLGRKGGGPIYSFEMTKGLIENGCKVYLFISKYVDNLDLWLTLKTEHTEIIKTFKGKFSFIIQSIIFRFIIYRRMKNKYKNIFVDACYIPMGHAWDCYIVNSLHNPQKIITMHDPVEHSSNNNNVSNIARAISILNKGIFNKKPDDIIILSKVFFDEVVAKKIVSEKHIHVIPHCIFNHYGNVNNVKPFEYDSTKTNFLFFGRIDKYKGLDVLAAAFSKCIENGLNATLTIVGSGDFSLYKRTFSKIENVTIVNKWIKDEEVASFFTKKVILVLPYIDASQSGVIPIAMAQGVPIIASDTGGLCEQIENNVTGFLVPPSNANALFEKMVFVSKIDCKDVIANAKKYINNFTGKQLSKRIIDIISAN